MGKLPFPIYVVVLDSQPYVAVSANPFCWYILQQGHWVICDKLYVPHIFVAKTHEDIEKLTEQFPQLKGDVALALTHTIVLPPHLSSTDHELIRRFINTVITFSKKKKR